MKQKAQAAVETLLIYGVTILIVMLAIGALIGFGVIDLGKMLPDKCDITNGFVCENYAVSTGSPGRVQLELRNTLGANMQNFTVNIYGEDDNQGLWDCTETLYDNPLVNGVVSDVIEIPCNVAVPAGKKITGVVDIIFNKIGSKISTPVKGTIRATVS